MIPFFMDHYEDIVDAFIVYDNGSTDRSLELLADYPKVSVRHFDTPDDSFVYEELRLSEEVWKESRGVADWVIFVDMDEFIVGGDLRGYLAEMARDGVSFVRTVGFDMVSKAFPSDDQPIVSQITRGFRAVAIDKPCIFDPNKVTATNFTLGRHGAFPTGDIKWPDKRNLLLLHYKTLGWDYYYNRTKFLATGLKPRDIAEGLGAHYLFSEQEQQAFFDRRWNRSGPVPGLAGGLPSEALLVDEADIAQSGLFDFDWYVGTYPHVARSGYDALSYFTVVGGSLGEDPSLRFNSRWYTDRYLTETPMNPLLHYIRLGRQQGFEIQASLVAG
jgi:hypothetical protein